MKIRYTGEMLSALRTIVETLSEGLLVIDFSGKINYTNPSARFILGIGDEEIEGKKFAALFLQQEENDDFVQTVLDTIYQREGIPGRIVSYHTGTEVRQLRITSSLFTQPDGKIQGISIVLVDLSELIELQDSVKAMKQISHLNHKLNARNKLLSKTFGQFLSDDIVRELLETPGAVEPGGKKRTVTVMMSDLRGFTAMSERMDATDLLVMLNHYLETMTDIIQKYHGTIIEFLGDGIMAIFGAPVQLEDHADKAVAAALMMQDAMGAINRWNAVRGFPILEMGIGLSTGEVIIGIIGSAKRMKYGVIGAPVNQCGRIESYTTGGQILISPSLKNSVSSPLEIEKEMTVFPKGVNKEVVLSQVTGLGEPYHIHIAVESGAPVIKLKAPIPICFFRLEGKHILEQTCYGGITAVGDACAYFETETKLEVFDNLQIHAGGQLLCKVMEQSAKGYLIHYTSIPSGYSSWLQKNTEADQ